VDVDRAGGADMSHTSCPINLRDHDQPRVTSVTPAGRARDLTHE